MSWAAKRSTGPDCPHAQSLAGSHSEDRPECVPVLSGQATPMVDDVPHPPETGDAARCRGSAATTARRRTPHRHACPLRHACPRRILARLTAPTIRSGIDFHSTAHGHVPVGPHSVAACGRLVPTAPPGSPVPVGRFCAAPVAAPSPTLRPDEIRQAPGRPPPHARRSPNTPVNGDDCAGQRPCGWLQGSEVSVVRSGPCGPSADSAAGVDGLRSH